MLVERLSNLEDLVQQQRDAMLFTECCKYGRLNPKVLRFPYIVSRKPRCVEAPGIPRPSMAGLIVDVEVYSISHPPKGGIVLVSGKEVAERVLTSFNKGDSPLARGRFRHSGDEAIQRLIDTVFDNSDFNCFFLQSGTSSVKFSISLKKPGTAQLHTFLEKIPLVVQTFGHAIEGGTYRVIEVCDTAPSWVDTVITIQEAINLPDGPRKEHCIQTLDSYGHFHGLGTESALVEIDEVCEYLTTKGYVRTPSQKRFNAK